MQKQIFTFTAINLQESNAENLLNNMNRDFWHDAVKTAIITFLQHKVGIHSGHVRCQDSSCQYGITKINWEEKSVTCIRSLIAVFDY